jgi:integrase/recombinase XerD
MVAIRIRDRMTEDLRLRGRSPLTIRSYMTQAQLFCAHYGKSPLKLGEKEVRAYLLHRLDRDGASGSTNTVCLASLKFLYGVTLKRPEVVAEIPFPKVAQRLPEMLTGSEVRRWLECITPANQRMIASLLYGVGLRASEALGLRPEHIDSVRGVVHVRQGKGQRDRDLPLHPKLLQQLRQYWKGTRSPRGGYFFPGSKATRPLSLEACRDALRRGARKAGIRKRVSAHTLRHCYATHTLQLGANPASIQKLLGHSSILTTMRYLRLVPEHLARVKNPFELLGTEEGDILS